MILGASFDTPEKNKAFKDKFDFPYDLLCDVDRSVGCAYGVTSSAGAGYPALLRFWFRVVARVASSAGAGYPARISYLIDPEGRIARVYDSVTPADHPEQVLDDIG